MGDWGVGVFENDAAMDVVGDEVGRFETELDQTLCPSDASWQDLDGPLVYVFLLGSLAEFATLPGLTRSKVVGWKTRYLEVLDGGSDGEYADYFRRRRVAVIDCFDRLLARLSAE
jgi:hypothetical protein